jgi:glycosyltransferase involved in cell wall biosynthesis
VICVDDGSTDDSAGYVSRFHARDLKISLHRMPVNMGTHVARLTAVGLVKTPFLTFLDPDDKFTGKGLQEALEMIIDKSADIVEFGCRTKRNSSKSRRCWLSPLVHAATPARLKQLFYAEKINCHVHRKIFRTAVYQKAISKMPEDVRKRRILRYEDKLHFAFILDSMRGRYYYTRTLGELRYLGLEDNSQSEAYQSVEDQLENDRYVSWVLNQTFPEAAGGVGLVVKP